ncbi:hypothetical protein FZEAL_7291 [Fusarium zealandicum]|uniref:Uncharacterized protein n=1 Tax=Fusarium zealandicum TaxID=1053134 RepID=A0A8H4XHY8_9HYPO|nr:hypothetical protein FZEAL_7291 [Fusarium zealandicum]
MESKKETTKYSDFSPPGKPGVPFRFADFDPGDIEARGAHVGAFMRHMGRCDDWAKHRADTINSLSAKLYKDGLKEVGSAYFYYMIDRGIWTTAFATLKLAGEPYPRWPWGSFKGGPADMSKGVCQAYADWLLAKENSSATSQDGHTMAASSAEEAIPDAAPDDVSKTQAAATPPEALSSNPPSTAPAETPAVPDAPKTTRQRESSASLVPASAVLRTIVVHRIDRPAPRNDAMVPPPVPTFSERKSLWEDIFGDGSEVEPVCGPFEVTLPKFLDFEGLVWGSGGSICARVQNELDDGHLAISWVCDEITGRPQRLVVGFAPDFESPTVDQQIRLVGVFDCVVSWVRSVRQGSGTSLDHYFNVRADDTQRLDPSGTIAHVWKNLPVDEMRAFHLVTRMNRLREEWGPEILQILQKSLEEEPLKQLNAWVFQDGFPFVDQRINIAEDVWIEASGGRGIRRAISWAAQARKEALKFRATSTRY